MCGSAKAMLWLQNRDGPQPAVEGVVRIGADVVFRQDVLGPQLLARGACREVRRANTKGQMSLDPDDIW